MGRPFPNGYDAFPLCFTFPPISENLSDSVNIFHNFTFFLQKISVSIRTNFWWPFLVVHTKFLHISQKFTHFLHCFRKNLISPLLFTISFLFSFDYVSCLLYAFFSSSLFWPWCVCASYNTRTGRPCLCICLSLTITIFYINNIQTCIYYI